jgi:hypothetical protein
MRRTGLVMLLAAWTCVAQARAAELPRGASVTAVYLGEADEPEAAARAAQTLALLSPPVRLSSPPTHLDQLVTPGAISVRGAQETVECSSDPISAEAYRAEVQSLYQSMWAMGDTRPAVQRIKASQACLTEVVGAGELARVSFLEGVVEFSDGNDQEAFGAFKEALALQPMMPWDADFAPDAELRFANAATELSREPLGSLRVIVPAQSEVQVDGTRLETPREGLGVAAGRHLVQIRATPEGALRNVVIVVTAEATAMVVDPAALEPANQPPGVWEEAVALLLDQTARESGIPAPTYLVRLGKSPAVWVVQAETQKLTPVVLTKVAISAAAGEPASTGAKGNRGLHPAAPVLVVTGSALAVVGAIVASASWGQYETVRQELAAAETADEYWAAMPTDSWLAARTAAINGGLGLVVAGGVTMAIAIPVGVATSHATRQVTVGASLLFDDPRESPGSMAVFEGVQLSVGIR